MKIMINFLSCICNSYFVCWYIASHLFWSLILIFLRKANGRCECFYDWDLTSSTFCCFVVLEFCRIVFLMKVKSGTIIWIVCNCWILIECIFFVFSPFLYSLWKVKNDLSSFSTLHKKWSFPLRICSVNVTKSAGNFFVQCIWVWWFKIVKGWSWTWSI